jgi:hypothetical protein
MTPKRYKEIQLGAKLSQEEFKKGWHYCPAWNYLLIGPGMQEMKSCPCFKPPSCPTCED